MARLNDDGQWIIMMAFIICTAIFFLALVINESTLVGQTTAEGVLEFSKSDIQDLRNEGLRIEQVNCQGGTCNSVAMNDSINDIEALSIQRKNSIVQLSIVPSNGYSTMKIHYNNGVTTYDEISYL
jgi:hypothetical protein